MFGSKTDLVEQQLISEIEKLSKEVARLEGRLAQNEEALALADDYAALKKQVVDLEIERDKAKETHDRREREVRHEVGLLRKQTEVEQEQAKREAILEVREENLESDRKRFEEQMKFTTARFEKEVEYLHNLAGQILERLPHVEVNKTVEFDANGNGQPKAEVES